MRYSIITAVDLELPSATMTVTLSCGHRWQQTIANHAIRYARVYVKAREDMINEGYVPVEVGAQLDCMECDEVSEVH